MSGQDLKEKTSIFFVRHSVTPQTGKLMYGRLPGHNLSDEGIELAKKAANHLGEIKVDLIVSSPVDRAVQTAQIIADTKKLVVQTDEAFFETDIGEWAGRTFDECKKLDDWKKMTESASRFRFPSGESFIEMQHRMFEGAQKLVREYTGKNIVVVSHRDPIISLMTKYLCVDLDKLQKIPCDPASISLVEYQGDNTRVRYVNLLPTLRMV